MDALALYDEAFGTETEPTARLCRPINDLLRAGHARDDFEAVVGWSARMRGVETPEGWGPGAVFEPARFEAALEAVGDERRGRGREGAAR